MTSTKENDMRDRLSAGETMELLMKQEDLQAVTAKCPPQVKAAAEESAEFGKEMFFALRQRGFLLPGIVRFAVATNGGLMAATKGWRERTGSLKTTPEMVDYMADRLTAFLAAESG